MKVDTNVSQNIDKNIKTSNSKSSTSTSDVSDTQPKNSLNDSSKVSLSEEAQMMSKAKELAEVDSSVDMDKVRRLQSMIDGGDYKVNAEAIADRLVDDHLMA